MEGLSINEINNTNQDVVVTYTPSSLVSKYSYTIIKSGVKGTTNICNTNEPINIVLNETGSYKIEIINYDSVGNATILNSGEYIIDKEKPIINIKNKTFKIKENETVDYLNQVTATDIEDGDLTNKITTNYSSLDLTNEGIKTIEYSVQDSAGNVTIEKAYITVVKDNTSLIRAGQIGIFALALILILFIYKYIKSIKIEKRFSKYTINSSKNFSNSLLDNLYEQYNKFLVKFSDILSKSHFLMDRAKRYNKYIIAFDLDDINNMKFMANKIVIGFVYIITVVIINLFNSKFVSLYELILPFILGFYTLDLIYMYKYLNYKKVIENDLLEAITIMNNAFKAGMSIVQAIELVSTELSGPIAKEFKKISIELSFGLDVEVAFKRFADRIKLNDAVYLTSSLSILNKTGGNIIKVFNSIEKTMFSRKKLEQEFKSLTSSSKFIMYVLILVPIVFVAFLGIINIGYFEPLFTNPLGIALIVIMLIIYIAYIIIVKKIMKVRM